MFLSRCLHIFWHCSCFFGAFILKNWNRILHRLSFILSFVIVEYAKMVCNNLASQIRRVFLGTSSFYFQRNTSPNLPYSAVLLSCCYKCNQISSMHIHYTEVLHSSFKIPFSYLFLLVPFTSIYEQFESYCWVIREMRTYCGIVI